MHKVTFIPGDGIGPEVAMAARRCVDATGVSIHWEDVEAGEGCVQKFGTPLPNGCLASIKQNRVAIKGPITTPIGTGIRSVNVALRKELDLYACVRPCKTYPGIPNAVAGVNLVIVRENTEDLYAGIEFSEGTSQTEEIRSTLERLSGRAITPGSAISIKPISPEGSRRVARFAFEYALANGRKKVTCVHKANIMKATDGLFLRVAQGVARDYQGRVQFEDRLVDNLCMQLVQRPHEYDLLLLPNLYGDIVSDLCAGLVGGLGVAPGANIGEAAAVFEPTHGSAPKYKGQNKVNPTAEILSAVLMLRHLNEAAAADRLEKAVAGVLLEGKRVTYDLKRDRHDSTAVGTQEMADEIIRKLKEISL